MIQDDFNRVELNAVPDSKRWWVNDERAQRTSGIEVSKFQPQAKINDGVLNITRTAGSDHGAAVRIQGAFQDGVIQLRFRLPKDGKFGVNLNDPDLKTVHAGHLCRVEIGTGQVLIQDQKTGNMDLEFRKWRDAGASQQAVRQRLAKAQRRIKSRVEAGTWHDLKIELRGETIEVAIDGEPVGSFSSPGIGHPTKRNLALAVPGSVEIDDLRVHRIAK